MYNSKHHLHEKRLLIGLCCRYLSILLSYIHYNFLFLNYSWYVSLENVAYFSAILKHHNEWGQTFPIKLSFV